MGEFNQSKYVNNFIKEKYDTIKLQCPKGYKELIQKKAKEKGYKSTNAYIYDIVRKDVES